MSTRPMTTLADYHEWQIITNGKVIGLNEAASAAFEERSVAEIASCLRGSRVSKPNPADTRFSDGRDEPSAPTHDRGHDGPQSVAGDAAIVSQRHIEVQPVFWPVA